MKRIIYLIVMIFLIGCVKHDSNFDYASDPKEKLADEISREVAMQLKKERNLHPCGFGGGTIDQVRMLALSFEYFKQVEIEEARDLLLAAGNLFLKKINDDERIRPYLKNYPFNPENIEIEIFLNTTNHSEFRGEELSLATMKKGILKYKIFNLETKQFKTIYEETVKEATVHSRESSSLS